MIDLIQENHLYKNLTSEFCRSGKQINSLNESDSELLIFENDSDNYLAVTIDSISEEINSGLYDDPYLIGWMSVMVNLSDVAAVGAEPVGVLISEIFPENLSEDFILEIQRGISDAVNECNTFVLGGDTNSGESLIMTGCAIGKCSKKYLTRIGCKPGEILYSSGLFGRGNVFALSKLIYKEKNDLKYHPKARIKEGLLIKEFASSCMDSSDGLISTLDQLLRLNNVGFKLKENWKEILDPESEKIAVKYKIPAWLLLAGEHGEFELIFTIPLDKEKKFLEKAEKIKWQPVKLGKVVKESQISIALNGKIKSLDTARIRNLSYQTKGDVNQYLSELLNYDITLCKLE